MQRLLYFTVLCLALGCSKLRYISPQDTTQANWEKVVTNQDELEIKTPEIKVTKLKPTSIKPGETEKYRTPLAGQPWEASISGGKIHLVPVSPGFSIEEMRVPIAARDRTNVAAINVGLNIFSPDIGDTCSTPFAAFYYRRHWQESRRRLRLVASGLVNYIDFAEGSWNQQGLELLLNFENSNIPFGTNEIVDGKDADFLEIEKGFVRSALGIGWRTPIAPYHVDNDFRIQLFYQPGYLYSKTSDKTGPGVMLPPDTFEHRLWLRLRFDSFDRNLMELPHRGFAWGTDFVIGRRDRWADHQFSPVFAFTREDTRDYLQVMGYATLAMPVPFLSERHRLLVSTHGGWSPSHNWDRFSAFRIGGGPPPSETDDLARQPFPGALFDQFIAEKYLLVSTEYRLELNFYLYLHVRGTLVWGNFGLLETDKLDVVDFGSALSIGITSGFLWDSVVYLEYSLDDGFIRQGSSGHAVMLNWAKALW